MGHSESASARTPFQRLAIEHSWLIDWLLGAALPLWAEIGTDRDNGGFYEQVSQAGDALDGPRRTRLVSRQVYVFASGPQLGWRATDLARMLVGHGLDYLLGKCLSESGVFHSVIGPDGSPLKPNFDLYDHAFGLFALATAARLGYRKTDATLAGRRIRDSMVEGWKHPVKGFEESQPPQLPLNSNQHMHLLEAFLEWEQSDRAPAWAQLSDEIVGLAIDRFIDPQTGALREHYDHDWLPAGGEIGRFVEPGHQFEWSWLLWRWAAARGRNEALSPARRLVQVGENYGVSTVTGLAINGLWDDLSVRDDDCRLWPQTERIKAHLWMAEQAQNVDAQGASIDLAAGAVRGLRKYFDTAIPGLWHETIDPSGQPTPAPARASSLYHIVCATTELHRFVRLHASRN